MMDRFDINAPGEVERRRKIAAARTMHGHRIMPKGSPEMRTWQSWAHIQQRCGNVRCKDYPRYGGRGITVCPEWSEYVQFLADMGLAPEGKSIDRIDNSLGYLPGNCRWATKQEQARNRRSSRLLTINGETKTLAEWADLSGIASSTIRMRITYNGGVVDESTVLLPPKPKESFQHRRDRLDRHAADMRAEALLVGAKER